MLAFQCIYYSSIDGVEFEPVDVPDDDFAESEDGFAEAVPPDDDFPDEEPPDDDFVEDDPPDDVPPDDFFADDPDDDFDEEDEVLLSSV